MVDEDSCEFDPADEEGDLVTIALGRIGPGAMGGVGRTIDPEPLEDLAGV